MRSEAKTLGDVCWRSGIESHTMTRAPFEFISAQVLVEMTNELADMDDVMLEALAELGRAINEDEPENLESAKVASPGCT